MKTYEELQCEIEQLKLQLNINKRHNEFEASLAHVYHFSGLALINLGRDRRLGSGVIIEIRDVSGKTLVNPTLFKDGLSDSTINSLLDDMEYSFNLATELKPITQRK